jgi:hypothetical protein
MKSVMQKLRRLSRGPRRADSSRESSEGSENNRKFLGALHFSHTGPAILCHARYGALRLAVLLHFTTASGFDAQEEGTHDTAARSHRGRIWLGLESQEYLSKGPRMEERTTFLKSGRRRLGRGRTLFRLIFQKDPSFFLFASGLN